MTAREGAIVRRTLELLRAHGHAARKRHGTAFSVAGDPDIYGSRKGDGRHFELEMKAPGEEPTKLQRRRLAEWAEAGAIAGWATSAASAVAIVEEAA